MELYTPTVNQTYGCTSHITTPCQGYRLEEEEDAIALYIDGLSLGGTQNLHGLFAAAGANFDFGTETVGPLMDRVAEELSTLPA